jgi:hypothetical protein
MKKTVTICAVLLLILGLKGLNAQEAIITSGGNASGEDGSVSYSLGQVFYSTQMGDNGSVAQGVQQPYEISVVSSIEEAYGITLQVSAFPNPTADYLMLRVENYSRENLSYQLFDLSGKLLERGRMEEELTTISMQKLTPALYLLRVLDSTKEIKTFKIIKTK